MNFVLRNIRRFSLFLLLLAPSARAADWVELKNCTLLESGFNDGDSFAVECAEAFRGETQNRFRLFFVDTAETDSNSDFKKDRLKEQAAYWESDDPDFALKMGLRASQTVIRLLRGGFSVFTRGDYAPTLGRPRYYALIKVNDRWLDEILVEEGLVRIYGKGANLPDGTRANTHRAQLRKLEKDAKANQRNAWRGTTAVPVEHSEESFEPYDARILRDTWIYSVENGRKVTVLASNTTVTVVAPAADGLTRIRFRKSGTVCEGLCDKGSVAPRT